MLAHLVDLSSEESISERVDTIRGELAAYESPLDTRPWLLVGTKTDSVADRAEAEGELNEVASEYGVETCFVSAVTGDGVRRLLGRLFELVADNQETK